MGRFVARSSGRYFLSHGLSARVDAAATHAQEHIGPLRMRAAESEANERAREIARANGEAARDPEKVLEALTRNNATFSERDLDRYLSRHIFDEAERAVVHAKVLGHDETLALHERDTWEASGRFTTRRVRAEEREALREARALAEARHHKAVPESVRHRALAGKSLHEDQRRRSSTPRPRAGSKSSRGAPAPARVLRLPPFATRITSRGAGSSPRADQQRRRGFEGRRVCARFDCPCRIVPAQERPRDLGQNTVVIVDEAAMLDTRVTRELLLEARRGGARLILAGDDRQLASIERGGLFSELKQRHGSSEITEVTRQRVDWQRRAARDLAEGNFVEAVSAFAKNGAIVWTESRTRREWRWWRGGDRTRRATRKRRASCSPTPTRT